MERRAGITRRSLLAGAATLAVMPCAAVGAKDGALRLIGIDGDAAELAEGSRRARVTRGARFGVWTLVELLPDAAILEDFTRIDGRLLVVGTEGVRHVTRAASAVAARGRRR